MSELETLREQLTRVRTIIADIETNGYTSLGIDGKTFTRLDLKTLYDRETYLKGEIEAYEDDDSEDTAGYGSSKLIRWGKNG